MNDLDRPCDECNARPGEECAPDCTALVSALNEIEDADPPSHWLVCRRCERPAMLLQGERTAWYHEHDDSLVCGGRVWLRVPVASIPRLWAPVRWNDAETATVAL